MFPEISLLRLPKTLFIRLENDTARLSFFFHFHWALTATFSPLGKALAQFNMKILLKTVQVGSYPASRGHTIFHLSRKIEQLLLVGRYGQNFQSYFPIKVTWYFAWMSSLNWMVHLQNDNGNWVIRIAQEWWYDTLLLPPQSWSSSPAQFESHLVSNIFLYKWRMIQFGQYWPNQSKTPKNSL